MADRMSAKEAIAGFESNANRIMLYTNDKLVACLVYPDTVN